MDYRIRRLKNILPEHKGQAVLETALVFILFTLLFAGIVRIWLWSNSQIVQRQINYNNTRVAAGTSSDTYRFSDYWPVYAPENLSEERVIINTR